jgi:PAS domain S-box-containing protein
MEEGRKSVQTDVEAVISESERYRILVEGITDYAVYMLDPQGKIVSWNAGAQRFKGYERAEIIGRHFSQFYTEEDQKTNLPARALQIAEREGKFEQEGWRVRKDGSRMWAHVVIDPIRDRSGKLIGFAKITRDLTERRAAQEALRESEQRFRLLVQSVTDYALYMLNPEGNVTSWNIGAERIKGYSPDEIIGKHFSTFYTAEDRANGEPQKALENAARQGRFEKEGWRVRKDGVRFWANVVIDSIRDDAGTIIGFAKVTRDITERRNTQLALEKAREAFFQSQKTEALGQLTGGIAHDFNNLLMVIQSSLDLMRKRMPEDPKLARLLNNAASAAERGAALTQRMLAFARKQALTVEPIDIPSLIEGMLDLLERSLGPSVTVETQLPPMLKAALADANQLELAILNLAVNARDAMPEGGVITIAARQAALAKDNDLNLAPREYICISVIDRGEGMDEATLARAVEPFFTTKGIGKGTGLGLSMVQGMAEQSGGCLNVTSTKGIGTTVEIWLPADGQAASASEAKSLPEDRDRGSLQGTTILAVDDDPLVLGNLVEMLEGAGCKVLAATSGDEALRVLETGADIDLLISDHAMPNMTGSELIKRAKVKSPELRAILVSGYMEDAAPDGAGFWKLEKPFSQQRLEQVFAEILQSEHSAGKS